MTKKSKLKRRLRKKYHLAEFQELGFEISTELKLNLSDEEFDKFLDEFIDKIENYKLLFGGSGNVETWKGFVTAAAKYVSPTDKQKVEISEWLDNRPEISNVTVGEFRDAWYGWD